MTIAIEEPISPAQFRKIKLLFRVLSCLPVKDRRAVARELCPEDAAVRQLVLRLVEDPAPNESPS